MALTSKTIIERGRPFCEADLVVTSARYQYFLTIIVVIVIVTVIAIFIVLVLVIVINRRAVLTLMRALLIASTVTMLHTRNQCLDCKAWKPTWVRHPALHMRVLFN